MAASAAVLREREMFSSVRFKKTVTIKRNNQSTVIFASVIFGKIFKI